MFFESSRDNQSESGSIFLTTGRGRKAVGSSRLRSYLNSKRTITSHPIGPNRVVFENLSGWFPPSKKIIKQAKVAAFLVRNEPAVVIPNNYKVSKVAAFQNIVDLGRIKSENSVSLPWPQDWQKLNRDYFFHDSRKDRTVIIAANKISFVAGELYSLRRMCMNLVPGVDIIGYGWKSTMGSRVLAAIKSFGLAIASGSLVSRTALNHYFEPTPNYLGESGNKIRSLSEYRQSLVIENSAEYMSEKLFDSFFAGTIPIYVGPPVQEFGIPKELVVESKPEPAAIAHAIQIAKEMDFDQWRELCWQFLNDSRTRKMWDANIVFGKVLRIIEETSLGNQKSNSRLS